MTTHRDSSQIPRWWLAACVCAALLLQMALPALHAGTIEAGASVDAATWTSTSGGPAVTLSARADASHDPATCPVCQSLLRSNPLVTSPLPRGEACPDPAPRLVAAPARTHAAVARTGHPSRAPPARTLDLV